jgi:hypothetical protein
MNHWLFAPRFHHRLSIETLPRTRADMDLNIVLEGCNAEGYIFGRGDRILIKEDHGDPNSYHTGAK